jgi:hypothetical protein
MKDNTNRTHVCSTCDVEKPVGEYYRAPHANRGHRGECKTCTTERHIRNTRRRREMMMAGIIPPIRMEVSTNPRAVSARTRYARLKAQMEQEESAS